MRAVGVIGVDRAAFRSGLAATLVKDEADGPTFDEVFDRFFAVPRRQRPRGEQSTPVAGDGSGSRGPALLLRPGVPKPGPRDEPKPAPSREQRHNPEAQPERRSRQLARARALRQLPFREMSAHDIEECETLVAELAQRFRAHLSRRQRTAQRGRLDIRRTLRRSIGTGGVPIDPAFRRRPPRHSDLVVLCDCSHSVATASNFLLALIVPAKKFFRHVRLFAYVDHPVEISVESGLVVPHEAIDLYARSDLGRALVTLCERYQSILTRNTLLLVLGDARNNRRPPRADVLGRIRTAVREVIWLNPEPSVRWDTGDSVMRVYQAHCDTVLVASNLAELSGALRRSLTRL